MLNKGHDTNEDFHSHSNGRSNKVYIFNLMMILDYVLHPVASRQMFTKSIQFSRRKKPL